MKGLFSKGEVRGSNQGGVDQVSVNFIKSLIIQYNAAIRNRYAPFFLGHPVPIPVTNKERSSVSTSIAKDYHCSSFFLY